MVKNQVLPFLVYLVLGLFELCKSPIGDKINPINMKMKRSKRGIYGNLPDVGND